MAVKTLGNSRGVSLVEALLAIALLGVAAVSILPAFVVQMNTNTRNEQRTAAITAVQQSIEALRLVEPSSLPSSGQSAAQIVNVDGRDYEVIVSYCTLSTYCGTESRHILVEAFLDGQKVYEAETVYTEFL